MLPQFYCYSIEGDRNSVVSQVSCRMDVIRLEQHHAYIKIVVMRERNARECHSELVCSHSFHKLTVAFSCISPSQYGYFDVGALFYHTEWCLTYNWISITLSLITVEFTALYCILADTHSYCVAPSFKCEGKIIAMT